LDFEKLLVFPYMAILRRETNRPKYFKTTHLIRNRPPGLLRQIQQIIVPLL